MIEDYKPDPSLWSPRVAAIMTQIRDRLTEPASVLTPDELFVDVVGDALGEGGIGPNEVRDLWANGQGQHALRLAEIAYLLAEGFNELEKRGEIWGGGANKTGLHQCASLIETLMKAMGWGGQPPELRESYRPTVHLLSMPREGWAEPGTRWPNVDALAIQAFTAYRHGLDVAAAVTARVAVEEAVQSAHKDLGSGEEAESMKAWEREDRLFSDRLTTARTFLPLDRSATRALSSVRDRGNDAAHKGAVANALLQETLTLTLPQALASLSAAVEAALESRSAEPS